MPTGNDVQTTLVDYLAGSPAPSDVVVVTAEPTESAPVVVETDATATAAKTDACDAAMKLLLGRIKRIGMCAKDLHYRAKGKPFYGLHQLSDLVWQVEQETDDLIEIYFMGTRGVEPPRMDEVFAIALGVAVAYPKDDRYFIGGLMHICHSSMLLVDQIKKDYPDLPAGVHAVLDGISQKCLLSIGLLDQSMKG